MRSKWFAKLKYFVPVIISLFASVYLEAFLEVAYPSEFGLIRLNPDIRHISQFASLFVGFLILGYFMIRYHKVILHTAYRFRYIIATALLVICVIFELSGSSIACLGNIIGSTDSGTLFGIPRAIRIDEFGVLTPFSCSQYYNHSGVYPYFSETIRGTVTDTAIVYGLPSWSIATLFRPAYWGYLLFGPGKGLSFFWVWRMLALFFVSFEFGMFFTRRDKWLSLAYSVLIAFAPIVQWWFAINGLIEMLVFGQLALLAVKSYMTTDQTIRRVMASLLFFWCAGGYILTFYPAWQIPLFYVFFALFIFILLTYRKQFNFSAKQDLSIIGGGLALLVVCLGIIFMRSGETISATMNTVYPGNRLSTGGGAFLSLFKYNAGIFLPLSEIGINPNVCEASTFYDLFPLGVLMAFYVIFAEKKKDSMLLSLLVVQVIFLVYCIFGLPAVISRILLIGQAEPGRTMLAVGMINILLLIRSIMLIEKTPKLWSSITVSVLLSAGVTLLCHYATGNYIGWYRGVIAVVILATGMALAMQSVKKSAKKLFALFCTVLLLLLGGLVNPVQKGLDVIYKNDLVQGIEKISKDDDGLWIVEDWYPLTNVPIMAGAPTINSTNVYPDIERWQMLDPDGEYEEVYNRYAHIKIILSDAETEFVLLNPDYFQLNLNYGDLETLGVKYVLTRNDIGSVQNEYVRFTKRVKSGVYNIYEATY